MMGRSPRIGLGAVSRIITQLSLSDDAIAQVMGHEIADALARRSGDQVLHPQRYTCWRPARRLRSRNRVRLRVLRAPTEQEYSIS